jgi:hypothetical protein
MIPRIWKTGLHKVPIIGLTLLLAACHIAQPPVTSTPLKKTHSKAASAVETAETPPQLPSLEFEWDTGYSNVISPPADIRKAAMASCKARGYDQSFMISLALNEGNVRALFGCRGPN